METLVNLQVQYSGLQKKHTGVEICNELNFGDNFNKLKPYDVG